MELTSQNPLTLDFWQNTIVYAGHSLPAGTIGCAALNISDETINTLDTLCAPLNLFMGMVQIGQGTPVLLASARKNALHIVDLLKDVPPFSYLDVDFCRRTVDEVFTDAVLENAGEYVTALSSDKIEVVLDDHYKSALRLLRILPIMAHLGYSIRGFKDTMLSFAKALNDGQDKRTPDGYAAVFGRFFSDAPSLSENNSLWMSLSNISVQYVAAKRPGREQPQLVKRMHYVSFVGMFRSDLFEGLSVGHAPKQCPICGKWFLTVDARQTKYCGGYAPGDPRGRTCRQIGNLKGREQRELADDHPLKAIYNRRMNTITQNLHRGTIDKETAGKMKRLAKDKLLRALRDADYAKGAYSAEMEQAALLAEVNRRR